MYLILLLHRIIFISIWSKSLAVGSAHFVKKLKNELDYKAKTREIIGNESDSYIKEGVTAYFVDFDA